MTKKAAGRKAAASGDGEGSKVESAGWSKSSCTGKLLQPLEREGLLRPKTEKAWRLPGTEFTPTPADDERVAFVDHIHRGLSFPHHPFFVALLCTYGVQLHDLPPNSVQHIACFIVLCECYLGIRPNWALFKRIFKVKAQPAKDDPH